MALLMRLLEKLRDVGFVCRVRPAETATATGEEAASDGDWLPGMALPLGAVPPEPSGEFREDMHTYDPRVPSVIEFLRTNYAVVFQPVTVRDLLRVADEAGRNK